MLEKLKRGGKKNPFWEEGRKAQPLAAVDDSCTWRKENGQEVNEGGAEREARA